MITLLVMDDKRLRVELSIILLVSIGKEQFSQKSKNMTQNVTPREETCKEGAITIVIDNEKIMGVARCAPRP
ncbi:MAG: hypothetical protein HGB01_00075 [Chlorobiaceae bacterium]|nr:hypothetical protein [Chlorobiaceae bacterium]